MVKNFALIALFMPVAALAAPLPTHFTFSAPQSDITFAAQENGVTVHGHFTSFKGEATFDPAALASGSATVTIDLSSAASDSENVASNLKTADWFDIAHFPQATFSTHGFKALPNNHYEADGELALKGVKLPLKLDFTVPARDANGATASGTATLSRTAYKVGWKDTSNVADSVNVSINLKAVAAK